MHYIYIIIISVFVFLYLYEVSNRKKRILSGKIKDTSFESPKDKKLNFLWSKGIWEKNDYSLGDYNNSTESMIFNQFNNDIIWVRLTSEKNNTCDLDIFSNLLEKLQTKKILVTSDGDNSVPTDIKKDTFEKIISCPMIEKWYTQNYDGSFKHEKLKNYPIGFDLHTERIFFGIPLPSFILPPQNVSEKINNLLGLRKKFSTKKNKIFCDVHLNQHKNFGNERKRCKDILYNSDNIDFLPRGVSQKSIWKKYSQYKFIISIFGNGLDCHRTWESLFLGAIVIVKTSSLDPLYENLPVVIVKDWDECLYHENLQKMGKEI